MFHLVLEYVWQEMTLLLESRGMAPSLHGEVYFSCPRDTRVAGTKKASMRRAWGAGSRGGDGPSALWLAVADWPELGH